MYHFFPGLGVPNSLQILLAPQPQLKLQVVPSWLLELGQLFLGAQRMVRDGSLWELVDHHLLPLEQLLSLKTPLMVGTIAEIDAGGVMEVDLTPTGGRRRHILMNSRVPS